MDGLPFELIDRISSFLALDDLKRTLLVSPAFQVAAEHHSGAFANFTFDNVDIDGELFLKTYSGRRLGYLRYIEVHTHLSSLQPYDVDPDDLPCRESRAELSRKDKAFTEQIQHVFEIIRKAETDARLSQHGPGKVQLTILTPIRWVDPSFCRHRLSSAWRVHFLHPETLPQLESVRVLSICNPEQFTGRDGCRCAMSRLDLRVLIDMASRLPNLEYLGCCLGTEEWRLPDADPARKHFEHDFEGCARDSRNDFATALDEAQLSLSLRDVQLDFFNDLRTHLQVEEGGGLDLVSPATQDFFSSSLRVLGKGLRRLDLRVKADASLFWPDQGSASFPNLESLSVMFHPMTPSGSWYFCGANGKGASDVGYQVTDAMYPPLESNNPQDANWHFEETLDAVKAPVYFRGVPNEGTLNPFLEAFAKAASTMHALRVFTLWSPLANGLGWGISYARPGERATFYSPDDDFSLSRQLWWRVGNWRPESELHKLFQGIGRLKYDKEVVEHWNEESGGSALSNQEVFTESKAALTVSGSTYPGWRLA
ncbi:hypothetical protein EKO04_006886 [Ascochyta lentis]|uniref:F-box domain-containing protein n=1 Tax=Ascochyta lentis TaxID=205686 RepID=A0A8H7MCQ4_9PLEO|nr:hypothetical protein EKO04_006886 [Ascochyta lentis]